MSRPIFEIDGIGNDCYVINDRGRTVATITSQGYIDWLLKSPMENGPRLTSIRKETHLSYTLGLKLQLTTPTPGTILKRLAHEVESGGSRLRLVGECVTEDGNFASITTATLGSDPNHVRYEWRLETRLTCRASKPVDLRWIEFNNVYPGRAGLCMFHAPVKEYDCTLMVDRDGVVWRFPHQHLMHYSGKISQLAFGPGTVAGFFGEKTGSPVVAIEESSFEPDWAICDMYYDLHCGARPSGPIAPGQELVFRYAIKYLGTEESQRLLAAARDIPVDGSDRERHHYARLELGMNDFSRPVAIDRPDEASGFRPMPPQKVWDRETGHSTRGSLRITNPMAGETVWGAEPPSNIPPKTRLQVTGMIKTDGVEGKGAFIRLRYFTFVWHPTPHVEWKTVLESPPVNGTTSGWVKVMVPELRVPEDEFDYLVDVSFVLDGKGVAWLTDVDVDLQPMIADVPELEKGSSKKKGRTKSRSGSPAGAAR